ncbi:hypothetical protein HNQ02_003642 [Flavobacterium sp. 7E]|uniref:DUF3289 family protein n=1 Tax=Flavobacterium sp. 7E TaxID=2735898 RepID=UPI00156DB706|nr:DUF3289 family protein [Flavobacterium sp. 7E]NRS90695.1 hypothetical protein [Flavobacterium sp. 7E]
MGKITILANNFFENSSGSIREDASEIKTQSAKKVVQNGEKGVTYDKNKDRKPLTDISITKLEGPLDTNGKLVDKIVLGTFYVFKATPSRDPKKEEIALLKWAVKYGDDKRLIIDGTGTLNKLDGGKIIISLRVKQDFEKAKIYAFYGNAPETVSVELNLKKVKFPMLILQSLGRKGKKTKIIDGVKVSTNEIAVDLLYGDYTQDKFGFEKLRKEIYKEAFDVYKKDIEKAKKKIILSECVNHANEKANNVLSKIKEFADKEDSELFDIFKTDSKDLSMYELEKNIERMILKMENNEGGEYSHLDLTNAVIEHENTQKFIKAVKTWSIAYLKLDKFKDNLEGLRIIDNSEGIIYHSSFKKKVDKPRFNNYFDKFKGIQIAINDVWAYQINLTEYSMENNEPHGKIQFDFYDHFGLDFPDIEKYDQDIFIAWFVLQHFKGYKPFITKISFTSKF